MAVAARKLEEEYEYFEMPATRVYSHSISAIPQSEVKKRKEERQRQIDARRRAARRESFRKAMMLMNIGIAAGAVLVMLSRYSLITLEYKKVNELKSDIAAVELEIKALNVQFNSAISLENAKNVAAEAGMRYPTAGQIVSIQGLGENRATEYDIVFE